MTHTPNSDASERERLSAHEIAATNLASLIDSIDCFDNDVLREAIELLRADAETIRSLEELHREDVERNVRLVANVMSLEQQLAARSAEVEALRKTIGKMMQALPTNWCDSLLTGPDGLGEQPYTGQTIERLLLGVCRRLAAIVKPQEKSRDAG